MAKRERKMELDKNGYRSEKRDSFTVAVKVLSLILGLGVVIFAMFYALATMQGCGGSGSGSGTPVYDENGVCVENCGWNGDGYVSTPDNGQPSGDTPPTYSDGKPIPQPDIEPYVCPVNEPPEMCTPKEAKEARCIFYDYKTDSNPDCDLQQTDHCWCSGGFYDQVGCSFQSSCQKVPPDKYPPCVCWDFCGFFGEWDCGDGEIRKLSFMPDEGDGLCHIQSGDGTEGRGQGYNLLGKPGDPNPRYPLEGEPKTSYALSPDGQTLTSLTSMVTCTRL